MNVTVSKPRCGCGPERQAAIVRRIDLRPVVIEEEERIDLPHLRPRHRPARDEIGDVVAMRRMEAENGLVGHGREIEALCAAQTPSPNANGPALLRGRSSFGCGDRI